jgi:hypothetical protein
MKSLKRKLGKVLAVAVPVIVMASQAGSASAAPAVFSPISGVSSWSQVGALTLTAPPLTFVCPIGGSFIYQGGTFGNFGSPPQGVLNSLRTTPWNYCQISGGGQLVQLVFEQQPLTADKTGGAFSLNSATSMKVKVISGSLVLADTQLGPSVAWSVPWTNGTSMANPSKLVFSNTVIGYKNATTPMTLTATMGITSISGPLLTLN